MYTKGLVNSRRRKIRARDARTTLFSSSQVTYRPEKESPETEAKTKKKKKKKKKEKEKPKMQILYHGW